MTLKDGKTGMEVRIDSIGESSLKNRLMTMGLIPGTHVKILRSAPMGDPMEVKIRGYGLTLRLDDAAKIEVDTSAEVEEEEEVP